MSQGTPQPIRIDLTPEQKQQIREATGQDIEALRVHRGRARAAHRAQAGGELMADELDAGGTGAWIGFELTSEQREVIRKGTGQDAPVIYLTLAEIVSGRFAAAPKPVRTQVSFTARIPAGIPPSACAG